MEKKNHNDPYYHVGFDKQGCKAAIVEYINNKNILVKFEGSDSLKLVRRTCSRRCK